MSLEYELKWNNFNEFTEDGERVIDMPPNKVLLQSSDEGVTGGYYDGEGTWHEFGGGVGSSLQPILHLTVTNSAESTEQFALQDNFVENGNVLNYEQYIDIGETIQKDVLVIGYQNGDDFDFAFTCYVASYSDLVNCTYNDGDFFITDPSKEASASIVVSIGGHDD